MCVQAGESGSASLSPSTKLPTSVEPAQPLRCCVLPEMEGDLRGSGFAAPSKNVDVTELTCKKMEMTRCACSMCDNDRRLQRLWIAMPTQYVAAGLHPRDEDDVLLAADVARHQDVAALRCFSSAASSPSPAHSVSCKLIASHQVQASKQSITSARTPTLFLCKFKLACEKVPLCA